MRELFTFPICHAHQVFHPCRPCEKEQDRNQAKNWAAVGWLLTFSVFFMVVLWYSAGGR